MRLHGEDGKVYIVTPCGLKLWEVQAVDVSIDQPMEGSVSVEIKAVGGPVVDGD